MAENVNVNGTSTTDYAAQGAAAAPLRTNSYMSQSQTLTPSRGGTLKKKGSVRRTGSLSRSSSKRRSYAGSVRSMSRAQNANGDENPNSAFYTPIPTKGTPTELLSERFQEWRKVLKDLLVYFKEAQKAHESKAKSLEALSRVIHNTPQSEMFMSEGGVGDGTNILRQYHKQALAESNKAKQVEEDIIVQLTGLRSDLAQKIKEIKNLSGDFKNGVDKEQDKTKEAVRNLQESLRIEEAHPDSATGRGDPFLVRLTVDRQVEKQIDEENYLHQAFLNLEHSGRELESIVVGEIQKAYNAYAGILKRDADGQYEVVEALRNGPIALPRSREWEYFIDDNENFVDPKVPMRKPENIDYPGKDAPAAAEVRAGMLQRKSKYLKSYTPGWYVLSPTHLHEFKSQERLASQQPIMSLHLPEQKLGSHSTDDSNSHKFMLKGRQSGGMHRGHGWVFRAESRDNMLAWYEDVKFLTEKTGEERNAYVRRHARSLSNAEVYNGGASNPGSVSSEDINDEDEGDTVPYSAHSSVQGESNFAAGTQGGSVGSAVVGSRAGSKSPVPMRPVPGGRFPSDIDVSRHLHLGVQRSRADSSRVSSDLDDQALSPVETAAEQQERGRRLAVPPTEQNITAAVAEEPMSPTVASAAEGRAMQTNAAEFDTTKASEQPQPQNVMSGAVPTTQPR